MPTMPDEITENKNRLLHVSSQPIPLLLPKNIIRIHPAHDIIGGIKAHKYHIRQTSRTNGQSKQEVYNKNLRHLDEYESELNHIALFSNNF